MRNLSITAIALGAVLSIGAVFGINSYTVVQDGEMKTQKFLGEISSEVYDAGLHIVNPFSSFEDWDMKEQMKTVDISIPSQDKFKSGATLTIKWDMGNADLPNMQRTVGLQHQVEQVVITKPLDSILRSAGRQVEKAQDLFNETTVAQVQAYVLEELKAQANPYGINIKEVFISDIVLPDVIQRAIVVTKQLEEKEAQERATLAQQKLIYARQTAEAEAKSLSAAHNKKAAQEVSDAKAYEIKAKADAQLYAKQAEAKGNKALAASVTPNLLKLKEAEADLIRAQNWKGGTPTHVFGGDSNVQPLYHMGNSK